MARGNGNSCGAREKLLDEGVGVVLIALHGAKGTVNCCESWARVEILSGDTGKLAMHMHQQ